MKDYKPIFSIKNGDYYIGDSSELLRSKTFAGMKGKINLILTSPPFPLNKKKSYGNLTGEEYLNWFIGLAPIWAEILADDGSIVIEMGNAWEHGRPVQSLLHLKSLIGFAESGGLRLIQESICYNPARLPSPAQWVTIKRLRLVDSYTHVWWFAKSDFPKADNRKVLRPYSKSMESLLKKQTFNYGKRPSGHNISEKGFLTNHDGAIAQNVFELECIDNDREARLPNAFSFANTKSNDFYTQSCRSNNILPHPAQMPMGLVSFFIQFLTEENDLILDPFAGSNTTGYVASLLNRRWIGIEIDDKYVQHAKIRFSSPEMEKKQ